MRRKMYWIWLISAMLFLTSCQSGTGTAMKQMEEKGQLQTESQKPAEVQKEDETGDADSLDSGTDQDEKGMASNETVIKPLTIPFDHYPVIDGSTATIPLARMLCRLSAGVDESRAANQVSFTKTTNSYIRLMDKEADLVIAYEAGEKAKEDPRFQDLRIEPIGLDALVFLCNEGNPVTSLTSKQIQDIYTGRITNWKDVGGKNEKIAAFQRPSNSGSQTLMENLMMRGIPMAEAPQGYTPSEMGDLIEAVASYNNQKNALGYSVYYYARNMYTIEGIRFMAIDGVMPEHDTIQNGSYGYVNPFYAAVRKDADPDSYEYQLFQWLTGEDGQSLIEEMGYVSVNQGRKKLPSSVTPQQAEHFHTDRRLIVDTAYVDGSDGILVFDESMKLYKKHRNVRVADRCMPVCGNVILAMSPDAVKLDEYWADWKYGLFDIQKGIWLIRPDYDEYYIRNRNSDHPRYYLVRRRDMAIWDGPGDLEMFDENGKLLMHKVYTDREMLDILLHDVYEESSREAAGVEYAEDGNVHYQIGEEYSVLRSYETGNQRVTLYHGDEVMDEGDYGSVTPQDSVYANSFIVPDGWTMVQLFDEYDMDDKQTVPDSHVYIFDENGNLCCRTLLGEKENIELAQKDYLLIFDYQSEEWRIMDHYGNLLYFWRYSRDYEWEE